MLPQCDKSMIRVLALPAPLQLFYFSSLRITDFWEIHRHKSPCSASFPKTLFIPSLGFHSTWVPQWLMMLQKTPNKKIKNQYIGEEILIHDPGTLLKGLFLKGRKKITMDWSTSSLLSWAPSRFLQWFSYCFEIGIS